MRLVLVCDECGAECSELGMVEYRTHALFLVPELPKLSSPELGGPAAA